MGKLSNMKETADNMAARDGKDYVVVDLGGYYQIWNRSIVDKCGRNYVYATGEVSSENDWDDLLS